MKIADKDRAEREVAMRETSGFRCRRLSFCWRAISDRHVVVIVVQVLSFT